MMVNSFCLRYVLLLSFILLGLSGVVVCASGGYFMYQVHQNKYPPINYDSEGPLATLLIIGLLTCGLAMYFWFVVDFRYNWPQFMLFSIILVSILFVEVCAGTWALIKHEQLHEVLSSSLHETLSTAKVKDSILAINYTSVKLNCCGYNDTLPEFVELTLESCCDFDRLDNNTRFICEDIQGTECQHVSINKNCSILLHVFLVAFGSIIFQILVLIIIIYYTKFLKKQKQRRQQRVGLEIKAESTN